MRLSHEHLCWRSERVPSSRSMPLQAVPTPCTGSRRCNLWLLTEVTLARLLNLTFAGKHISHELDRLLDATPHDCVLDA